MIPSQSIVAARGLSNFRVRPLQPPPVREYNVSAFLITLNTNQFNESDNNERVFEEDVKDMLTFDESASEEERLRWLKLITPEHCAPGTDLEGMPIRLEEDPVITVRAETGPRTHRLHAHALLIIKHHNKIHINRDEILRQMPNVHYVNVRSVWVSSDMAYIYVHKMDDSAPSTVVRNRRNIRRDDIIKNGREDNFRSHQ